MHFNLPGRCGPEHAAEEVPGEEELQEGVHVPAVVIPDLVRQHEPRAGLLVVLGAQSLLDVRDLVPLELQRVLVLRDHLAGLLAHRQRGNLVTQVPDVVPLLLDELEHPSKGSLDVALTVGDLRRQLT